MNGLYYLVPTLIAIVISLLIVRAGAIALMMTGMSFDKAKFQALSAFSGTGFTTHEAERVVNNARRRKIVSWLMILGNAGIVTVIVTATSSFAQVKGLGLGEMSASGMVDSVKRKAETLQNVVEDPEGTVHGMGRGLKGLFDRGRQAAEDAGDLLQAAAAAGAGSRSGRGRGFAGRASRSIHPGDRYSRGRDLGKL